MCKWVLHLCKGTLAIRALRVAKGPRVSRTGVRCLDFPVHLKTYVPRGLLS